MSGKSLSTQQAKALVVLGATLDAAPNQEAFDAMMWALVDDAIPAVADAYTLAGHFLTDEQIRQVAVIMAAELAQDAFRALEIYEQHAA